MTLTFNLQIFIYLAFVGGKCNKIDEDPLTVLVSITIKRYVMGARTDEKNDWHDPLYGVTKDKYASSSNTHHFRDDGWP